MKTHVLRIQEIKIYRKVPVMVHFPILHHVCFFKLIRFQKQAQLSSLVIGMIPNAYEENQNETYTNVSYLCRSADKPILN